MQKAVVKGSLADRSGHELDADVCPITGFDYRQKCPNFHRLAPYAIWWLTVLGFALLGLTITWLTITWLTVAGLDVDGLTVASPAWLTVAGLAVAGLGVALRKAAVKDKEQGGGSLDDRSGQKVADPNPNPVLLFGLVLYKDDRSLHTVLLSILAGVTIFAVAFACGAGVILAGLAEPAQSPLSPWLTEERLCGLDGSVWQNGVIVDALT